jgi:hypothetical protein
LCLLAVLFDAKAATRTRTTRGKADRMIAQRLRRLADVIRPGSCTASNNSRAKEVEEGAPSKKPTSGRRGKRRRR